MQPKMAQQGKQPQGREALLKSYNKRLKDDVKSILDNFMEIVKLGVVEDESQVNRMTQVEEIHFQMQVRSSNMVRAAESLMKLVADVKQYLILNDFPSVNEAITQNSKIFKSKSQEADQKLMALRDDMASDLYELEEEFYSSVYKEK
ncbi:mediator of RNA polymerase II transcription subunit 22 [Penaeus vannamei]|nr:mediator of RNA polymerase II transcription subunit 22-like [Penaeus vannamei]XP_037795905.1 mediator of RNA polymerase II transcription subunit 22-like [Penaeus monodon]